MKPARVPIAHLSRKGNNYVDGFRDFSGKITLPFRTHEGRGMGHVEADIRKACQGATLEPGLAIGGGRLWTADREIEAWLGRSRMLR